MDWARIPVCGSYDPGRLLTPPATCARRLGRPASDPARRFDRSAACRWRTALLHSQRRDLRFRFKRLREIPAGPAPCLWLSRPRIRAPLGSRPPALEVRASIVDCVSPPRLTSKGRPRSRTLDSESLTPQPEGLASGEMGRAKPCETTSIHIRTCRDAQRSEWYTMTRLKLQCLRRSTVRRKLRALDLRGPQLVMLRLKS